MMDMNTIQKIFFLILLLGFAPKPANAAQISVSFDRNPVSVDESFQIIFTANDTPDNDPDFSPLDTDFEVLGQSQRSNSSWVNGHSSKSLEWTLNVMAKHPGNLVVPAVSFGDDMSQPASILILEGSAKKTSDTDDDLFLEVGASPQNTYVQSQILYTVRFFRRVEIAQATLNEPELGEAVIEKLGDDSNYNTQINGVNYLVTERKYAIFPQKSGTITIKPLTLTAEVVANTRPNFNGFFNSQMTKTKKVSSKSVTLDVKPVPATFTGHHWISAEQLVLKEEWSGDNQQMKVGEPLTRTLSLLAKGATVGQLPELNSAPNNAQLKTYPDQPVLQEQKKSDGLISFREEKIAVIASKAGYYKLPAIEIPWFNTQTQKMEIAKIPETNLTAIDVLGSLPTPTEPTAPVPVQTQKTVDISGAAPTANPSVWIGVSAFLMLGWMATLVYFLTKRKANLPPAEKNSQEIRLADCIKNLKKACADNNAIASKDALLCWGRLKFNGNTSTGTAAIASLGAIAELCDARLRDEILNLNHALYGKATTQWQGKKLFQAFIEHKAREKTVVGKDDKLEPLYRL